MVQGYTQADSSHSGGWHAGYRRDLCFKRGKDAFEFPAYSRDNMYDQWSSHSSEEPKLRRVGKVCREAGGSMLTISGLKNFYYIPGVTDMRCGYNRLLQIVKQMTHHNPYNGDVFVFMSKDRRKVKMVHFENHAYYVHEKVYSGEYRFMLLEYHDEKGTPSYRMDWKDLVAVLESPVVKKLRLR